MIRITHHFNLIYLIKLFDNESSAIVLMDSKVIIVFIQFFLNLYLGKIKESIICYQIENLTKQSRTTPDQKDPLSGNHHRPP